MALFAVLQHGGRALLTASSGVQVHGNNVANANTVGYVRQTLDISARGTLRMSGGVLLGQGVSPGYVSSAYDRFSQLSVFQRGSAEARSSVRGQAFRGIENDITPQGDQNIGQAINALFNAFSSLESDPQSLGARADVLAKGQLLADRFRFAADGLTERRSNVNDQVQMLVDQANGLIDEVANLDQLIIELESGGAQAHDLRARRTAALEELSGLGPLRVDEDAQGRMTVIFAGQTVVERGDTNHLVTQPDPATGLHQVHIQMGSGSMDISNQIDNGSLGGALDVRDNVITGLLTDLDTLAFDLATAVNAQHSVGFDLAGGTGNNFFNVVAAPGSAASITLDAAVLGNPSALAASSTLAGLPGDNVNARALAALATQNLTAAASRTFSGFFGDISSQMGRDAKTAYIEEEGAVARLQAARDLRDEKSGVNMEEEAIDLLKWRDSYQAASRVISTANELLDTLFNIV